MRKGKKEWIPVIQWERVRNDILDYLSENTDRIQSESPYDFSEYLWGLKNYLDERHNLPDLRADEQATSEDSYLEYFLPIDFLWNWITYNVMLDYDASYYYEDWEGDRLTNNFIEELKLADSIVRSMSLDLQNYIYLKS